MLFRYYFAFIIFTFFLSMPESLHAMEDSRFASPEMNRRLGGPFFDEDIVAEIFYSSYQECNENLIDTLYDLRLKRLRMPGYSCYIKPELIAPIIKKKPSNYLSVKVGNDDGQEKIVFAVWDEYYDAIEENDFFTTHTLLLVLNQENNMIIITKIKEYAERLQRFEFSNEVHNVLLKNKIK